MSGRMSLVVFLLLFLSCSNASLEELDARMNRKFQDMERIVQHQNYRIKQLEYTVASQTVEIKELNGELVDVKSENWDKQDQISILRKMVLESFHEQSK